MGFFKKFFQRQTSSDKKIQGETGKTGLEENKPLNEETDNLITAKSAREKEEEYPSVYNDSKAPIHSVLIDELIYVDRRNREKVRELLDLGANPFIGYWNGTAFDAAVTENLVDIVKLFIDRSETKNGVQKNYNTPLHIACEKGHVEIVEMLINRTSANIESQNKEQQTPLFRAVVSGKRNIVEFLLNHGTNVNVLDKFQHHMLYYAAFFNRCEIAQLLLDKGADMSLGMHSPLCAAASQGAMEMVDLLLSNGACIHDKRDHYSETPILQAASKGHIEVVKRLLEKGANINDQNHHAGWTPLHRASSSGLTEMVAFLLSKGADPSLKNSDGRTPWDLAKNDDIRNLIKSGNGQVNSIVGKTLVIELMPPGDKSLDEALSNLARGVLAHQQGMGLGSCDVLQYFLKAAPPKQVWLVDGGTEVQSVIEAENSTATILVNLQPMLEKDQEAVLAVTKGEKWEAVAGDPFFDVLCKQPVDCYGRWSHHARHQRSVILKHSNYR